MESKIQNIKKQNAFDAFLDSGSFWSETFKVVVLCSLFAAFLHGVKFHGAGAFNWLTSIPHKMKQTRLENKQKRFYSEAIAKAKEDVLKGQFMICQNTSSSEWELKVCLAKIKEN